MPLPAGVCQRIWMFMLATNRSLRLMLIVNCVQGGGGGGGRGGGGYGGGGYSGGGGGYGGQQGGGYGGGGGEFTTLPACGISVGSTGLQQGIDKK